MSDENDLRARVEELEQRVSALEATVSGSVKLGKKVSLAEFVKNASSASTHKEKLVTIGYYLEAHEGADTFTTGDIEDAYQKIGESNTNFSARATEALSDGWIQVAESSSPREFELTRTGAEVVEDLLE